MSDAANDLTRKGAAVFGVRPTDWSALNSFLFLDHFLPSDPEDESNPRITDLLNFTLPPLLLSGQLERAGVIHGFELESTVLGRGSQTHASGK